MVGDAEVVSVSLVVDSCWLFDSPQIVLVDNVKVVAGDEEYVHVAAELDAEINDE